MGERKRFQIGMRPDPDILVLTASPQWLVAAMGSKWEGEGESMQSPKLRKAGRTEKSHRSFNYNRDPKRKPGHLGKKRRGGG